MLDSTDVKPWIIPDVTEASTVTSSKSQVAVIGSITSDAKTLQVLLAANDRKLRQTGVPSTVTATKNIPLPPPVTHKCQHEHTTQSQIIIKDIWINLKKISKMDIELWTKPKLTTYFTSPKPIPMQRSQVAKSIKTLKAKSMETLIKDKPSDQQGTHRTRKLTVKKSLKSHVTPKNHNNNKRWERSKSNSADTTTLSSRRPRSQQICVGAKSPVFRITVHGLKRYKHRYHYKCIVISCACRFSMVRDCNNHHRNFHKTILRCSDCRKGFRTPSACRDHLYMHK